LAEVLITLVVIGVISAITVPTIITNYQKQSIPAKLKKFYSTMNQA
jgi:type II secretory pathway pseudopilin PulG